MFSRAISQTACCSRRDFWRCFSRRAELLPGWGAISRHRASFLLQWEWFRIYFESGMVKLLSGDVEWRNFTAMDEYYQNGPLPTWVGWYVEHLPHWFHAATVARTLALELGLVFMMFFPAARAADLLLHCHAVGDGRDPHGELHLLNYLVLTLGFLLLDDKFLLRFVPARWRPQRGRASAAGNVPAQAGTDERPLSIFAASEAGPAKTETAAARDFGAANRLARPAWLLLVGCGSGSFGRHAHLDLL
jgi:hypothetical protein